MQHLQAAQVNALLGPICLSLAREEDEFAQCQI